MSDLLSVDKSFDVESKSWTDRENVLSIDLFQNRCLACIVKATLGSFSY